MPIGIFGPTPLNKREARIQLLAALSPGPPTA